MFLFGHEPLPLDNGGKASRDFIHARDMVRGLMACAMRGSADDVYNLATGTETTILSLAGLINAATGNAAPLELRPARDWDRSGRRFTSTEKSDRDQGFRAAPTMDEGIIETVAWTRANIDLISQCVHRHDKLMAQATG